MAYNDPQLLHLDTMLTEIAMGWDNPDDFVNQMFFPQLGVKKQSDRYYVYTRDTWGRQTDDFRAPGARANELPPMTLSRTPYFANEHALKDVVATEEQENADNPLQPMADATLRLTNTLELNKEIVMNNIITATSTYATGYTVTLSGTAQWDAYSTSTPISDVKAGRSKIHDTMFRDPNTAACSYQVAVKLEDHPTMITRIQYAMVAITTDEIISRIFGITTFQRAGAGKLTSAYGQAETVGYLWPKVFVLAYVPPRPAYRTPAYGYEFDWNYAGGLFRAVERWFDTDRNADIIRARMRYVHQLVAVDGTGKSIAGYLINAAIS